MILLFSLVMLLVAAVLVTKIWDDGPHTESLSASFDRGKSITPHE
jgi:hypothetical protein